MNTNNELLSGSDYHYYIDAVFDTITDKRMLYHCRVMNKKAAVAFPDASHHERFTLACLGLWLGYHYREVLNLPSLDLGWLEMLKFTLIHRHHWTPRQINELTPGDLLLALADIEGAFEQHDSEWTRKFRPIYHQCLENQFLLTDTDYQR